jgi:hypothetical protein
VTISRPPMAAKRDHKPEGFAGRSQGQWVCSKCKQHADDVSAAAELGVGPLSPDDDDDVECDDHDDVAVRSRREVIRLKNGGSAFGSRESLNLLGLEADDLQFAGTENCETILAADAIRLSAAAVASYKFATSEDEDGGSRGDALPLSPEEPGEISSGGRARGAVSPYCGQIRAARTEQGLQATRPSPGNCSLSSRFHGDGRLSSARQW